MVLPAHGTRYRYNYSSTKCRCDRCRQANAAYIRRLRLNGPTTPRRGLRIDPTRW